jgi:hypothetical protein
MPIGSFIGGMIGQQGAQGGGDMAWGAANQANQQTLNQIKANRAQSSPWTGSGTSALGKITNLLGLGELTQEGNNDGIYWVKGDNAKGLQTNALADFQTTPGYQFRQEEGTKALDRSAASKGSVRSGAQIKATQKFGQDIASEEYGNYLSSLFNLAGMGGQAQQGTAGVNSQLTSSGSNMLYQGGVQRGSAYAQGANALASGIGSGINNAFSLLSYGGSGGKFGLPGWS